MIPSLQNGVTRMLDRLEKVVSEKEITQRSMSNGKKPESSIPPNCSAHAQFLRGKIESYKHAGLNCVEAQSFCQQVVKNISTGMQILQDLWTLSVQENNVTHSPEIKALSDITFQSTLQAFDSLMRSVTWNGKSVFSGSFRPQFQIGIASSDILQIDCPDLSVVNLDLGRIDIKSDDNALRAGEMIQTALERLNIEFGKFCGFELDIKNKLDANSTTSGLMETVLSNQDDTDIPTALMELTQKDSQEDIIQSLLTATIEQLKKDAEMFKNLR